VYGCLFDALKAEKERTGGPRSQMAADDLKMFSEYNTIRKEVFSLTGY
jgi:hypothetical protein